MSIINYIKYAVACLWLLSSLCTFAEVSPVLFKKFGDAYAFQDKETGLWGIKVNGEVRVMPIYDSIARDPKSYESIRFKYFDRQFPGKHGLLNQFEVLVSISGCDSILLSSPEICVYERDGKKGVDLLRPIKKYRQAQTNKVFTYKRESHPIKPGDFEDLVFVGNPDYPYLIVAQKAPGDLRLIWLDNNVDYSPYYPPKKLGGNIGKVIAGKLPIKDLNIKKSLYDLNKEFDKISLKEGIDYVRAPEMSLGYTTEPLEKKESVIVETISSGGYAGTITEDGIIKFPGKYYEFQEVAKRVPGNPYVLASKFEQWSDENTPRTTNTIGMDTNSKFEIYRKEANEFAAYYKIGSDFWKGLVKHIEEIGWQDDPIYEQAVYWADRMQRGLEKYAEEADEFNKVASITESMNRLASALLSASSAVQGGSGAISDEDFSYSDDLDINSNGVSATKSLSYYQGQYDRWANRARADYESITRYTTKNADGKKEGLAAQSASPSTYVKQKNSYRMAQREMRSIRNKAARDGFTISQSEFENRPISY